MIQGFNFQTNYQPNFQAGFSPGVPSFGRGPGVGHSQGVNPQQLQMVLKTLMSAIQQLGSGYQGFGGNQGQVPGFNQFGGGGFPSFPQPQFPGQNPFQFYPSPGTPSFGGYQPNPYQQGGPQQPGGIGTPGNPGSVGPGFDPNFNWSGIARNTEAGQAERTAKSGLNERGRAALHLWGIQTASSGENDGGIYFNVLNNPGDFQPEEVKLVKELYNQEMALFGGVTGKLLDQHFFGVYEHMTGKDISGRYANAPVKFAQGPVNMENRANGNNGLNGFENATLRLWGHDTLDNGAQDGSVTEFTLLSQNALDKTDQAGGISSKAVESLLAADLADGVRDGNALELSFIDTLDKMYLGGPGASSAKTNARAGINGQGVESIIADWKENPPPGIPPGVDITNIKNIGKCPVLGQSVMHQGGMGGAQFFR